MKLIFLPGSHEISEPFPLADTLREEMKRESYLKDQRKLMELPLLQIILMT